MSHLSASTDRSRRSGAGLSAPATSRAIGVGVGIVSGSCSAARVALREQELDAGAPPVIDTLDWAHMAERVVVEDYLLAIVNSTRAAQADPDRKPEAWLRCFRGIDTLTVILILAELHDFRRFALPRALMAYLCTPQ